MVFYRKYRPLTLEEFDNKLIRKQLARFLSKEAPAHAFLFTGPKGTGKTSAARIIAKSINCARKKGDACGKCEVCTSIAHGDNLDITEIDAASNRGIDEIRTLKEGIKLTPLSLPYKVYIIDEVHMLTTEAFNALLKTLEEPPAHAVFILATTEPHKLLATIISRCIHVEFSKATIEDIVGSLKRITNGEKLVVSDEILKLIAKESDGSFRDAAKILEQAVFSGKSITEKSIEDLIGKTSKALQDQFLIALKEKDTKGAIAIVQRLVSEDKDIRVFVKGILSELESMLVATISANVGQKRSDSWSILELKRALETFSRNWSDYKSTLIAQLPLELSVIDYCFDEQNTTLHVATKKAEKNPSTKPTASTLTNAQSVVDESVQKVMQHWDAILQNLKEHNHSIVGVLRSCRPLSFREQVLTIESPYKFHMERLTEPKVQTVVAQVISDVVGSTVVVEVVMRKKVKS